MATTEKTEMPQNWVSEKPKIEETELNGNHQDDSGRVGSPRGQKRRGWGGPGASCPVPRQFVFCFSLFLSIYITPV